MLMITLVFSDNLPAPVETVEGDKKTVVTYELEDDKIKKVRQVCSGVVGRSADCA